MAAWSLVPKSHAHPAMSLFLRPQRSPCSSNDVLFVGECLFRMLFTEHVKIGFVDCLRWVAQSEPGRQRSADAHKTALSVLEVHPVRDMLKKRAKQILLDLWHELLWHTGLLVKKLRHLTIFGSAVHPLRHPCRTCKRDLRAPTAEI